MIRLIILFAGAILSLAFLAGARSWQGAIPGVVLAIVTATLYVYWRWRNQQMGPEVVSFDSHEVVRQLPDGSVERIRWDDVDRISIITTNEGPWNEDAYWVFEDQQRQNGCMIGNGAEGFPELLDHITKFDGFDDESVVEAMGCVDNNRFVIWSR